MRMPALRMTPALGAVFMLAACAGDNPLSTAQLEAVPDSHLYYPGSRVVQVSSVAQEAAQLNAAPVDGFVATTLRSGTVTGTVVGWYERTLPAHGWSYRGRESHGDVYDGHPVPPAYLFTRGLQEVFSLAVDPTTGDYTITYVALIDHCDTRPPYPLGAGNCADGKPK